MQLPKNKLSLLERKHLLTIVNLDKFGQLPPSQIVPRLADCEQYITSELTFYRVQNAENQLKQRPSGTADKTALQAACAIGNGTHQSVGELGFAICPRWFWGSIFTCICSSIFLAENRRLESL